MTKKENEKLIKDVLFELLGNLDNFEETEYKFFKAFHFFYKEVSAFKKMSIVTQYQIIEATLLIEIGAISKGIREARILTNPPPSTLEIKYSLSYGFEKSEPIKLENRKLLKSI